MLKDITTIKLQGANFASPTALSLFDPTDGNKIKTVKGAVLYGRNGSGKSTIARAFRVLSGEVIPEIKLAQALDASSTSITLTDEEKKKIFVFDEDYVNAQVIGKKQRRIFEKPSKVTIQLLFRIKQKS